MGTDFSLRLHVSPKPSSQARHGCQCLVSAFKSSTTVECKKSTTCLWVLSSSATFFPGTFGDILRSVPLASTLWRINRTPFSQGEVFPSHLPLPSRSLTGSVACFRGRSVQLSASSMRTASPHLQGSIARRRGEFDV